MTLKTQIQLFKTRFSNRQDTEHEQSFIRIGIALVALLYLCGLALFSEASESIFHGVFTLSLYLLFSLIMLAAIIVNPDISIARRIICMVGDMSIISYLHYIYGETAAPFFIIYLSVSSGYGLRYGIRYLVATTALAAIGFFIVISFNSDWQNDQSLGRGLLIGVIFLPIYFAVLQKKFFLAMEAVESANIAKSRFLANISHELRTPINGVLGLLEIFGNTQLTEKQRTLLHGAQSSAETLHHLIGNVLDISKIEADRVTTFNDEFDLHALVNGAAGLFEYAAKEKQLDFVRRIDPHCPYQVFGDELRIRQVLINLVDNAIKFTNRGRVEIQLRVTDKTAEYVTLQMQVQDTGIGISEEAQALIFEPFHQEDEQISQHFKGTGLGMSIAKQLTELMGGTITVTSVLGVGSTFTVELSMKYAQNTTIKPLNHLGGIKIISEKAQAISRLCNNLKEWGVEFTVDMRIESTINESIVIIDERMIPDIMALFTQYPEMKNKDVILFAEYELLFDVWELGYYALITNTSDYEVVYRVIHSLPGSPFDNEEQIGKTLPQPEKTAKILVADDNLVNQQVTQSFLEQVGHTVTVFSDGQSALDALTSDDYDLAIVDMMMPEQSGLDVIKLYRQITDNTELPFIMLTANVSQEVRTSVESLGVKYLTKPLRGYRLQEAVGEILDQRIEASEKRSTRNVR
ncbi:MAG: ATP-binding protein [Candidatus Thiodiazotropha sp.]